MKGFTKDGKFRPTGRTKSSLNKSDLELSSHTFPRIGNKVVTSGNCPHCRFRDLKNGECPNCGFKGEERSKESLSYNDSKKEVFSRIMDKGFVITQEREEIPISEREELGEDVYISNRIQISEEQLLGVMNGKRSAGEMIDIITDTNEDERLRFDIDTSNHLLKLEEDGKAKLVDGKWMKIGRDKESLDDDDEVRAEGFAEQFDTKEEYEEALRKRSEENIHEEIDDYVHEEFPEGWLCKHGWTKEGIDCPKCNPEY